EHPLPACPPADGLPGPARRRPAGRRACRPRGALPAALARPLRGRHRRRDRRTAPRPRRPRMSRPLRLGLTLGVTAACVAYILWKIDLAKTVDILRDADPAYFLAAAAIMIVTTVPMAWRWQQLLTARAIREPLSWLTRTYFIAYTANQV